SAEASANLVVLRTPAGGAQLLASALDHAGWPAILGTVAGDDTVLVITRDPAGGAEVAAALLRQAERKVAGGRRAQGGRGPPPAGGGTAGDSAGQRHRPEHDEEHDMTNRVVLAYSGGLDTSVAIGWIAEQTGAEVIAVAMDVGQGGENMATVRDRALACGAADAEVVDAREEFATGYCLPAIKANALYMNRSPLVSALSRPLIVKHLARVARERGADTVAHGCTGKGNDQVRFEVGLASLAPEVKVLAPVRDSGM